MTAQPASHSTARFGRLVERRGDDDFPYYDGRPVEIAAWKWVLVVVSCAVGFAALILIPQANNLAALLPRVLFVAIPLAAFIGFTGKYWKAIFRRLTRRDFATMIVFWLLNLAVTTIIALAVSALFGANANGAFSGIAAAGPAELVFFYLGTGIQLFGEELFSILPFLAVLYLLHKKAGLSRNTSVLLAWLITALWFAAAHLPTYGWNFAQAFLVIGAARLVLTLAYIRTKNIAVSTGAHILNDWWGFTFAVVTAATVSR